MDLFNVIAGAASIVSLAFAAFVYHRERVKETSEQGNVRLLQERLRHVEISLRAAGTTLQILIRRADGPDAPVAELQNIGRAVRSHLYGAIQETSDIQDRIVDWKFGELLASSVPRRDKEQAGDEQSES